MKFKLTDLGKIMEAQLAAGSKPVITRIEASDAFSSNEGALLSVQNKKQDLEIEEIAVIGGASHLKFVLHNVGLAEEYLLRQIGIYARQQEGAEEILYIIGQDKAGERVPASSEKLVEYEYDLAIHTENTYEAQVVVKSSYFATKGEMEELDRQKVSASGGDVSGTVSGIQEPEKEGEKYPEPRNAWTVDKIFGGLFRWVKSLKSDKVDAAGGDIADTTVSEFTEEAAQFPVPAPREKPKTLWGKMKKFVEDFKAWYTGVCLIGHIVNNCTSTANNLPLAAAQGKALMDLYTQLYSDLAVVHAVFTPLAGINVFYNNSIYKFGKVVCYNFQTPPVNLMSGENYVIATVPKGFRPVERAIGMVLQENGNPIAYNVHPDGNVTIYGNIDNKIIVISGSYIVAE